MEALRLSTYGFGLSLRGQRFDVLNQREQLLLADEPLEHRHNGLKAGRDLCRRRQDRFAQVAFIGRDDAAVLQLYWMSEHVLESRPVTPGVGEMTGVARQV